MLAACAAAAIMVGLPQEADAQDREEGLVQWNKKKLLSSSSDKTATESYSLPPRCKKRTASVYCAIGAGLTEFPSPNWTAAVDPAVSDPNCKDRWKRETCIYYKGYCGTSSDKGECRFTCGQCADAIRGVLLADRMTVA